MLSSIYGLVGQDNSIYQGTKNKENFTYSLNKGALINLTRQMSSYYTNLASELIICPGGVYDKSISKKINIIKNL